MISYPYCNYFMHYACFVRDFWLHIDKNYILKDDSLLKSSLEDNLDEMMYLHDLLNSNKPEIKKVGFFLMKMLINAFLTYCVIPCIVGSFTMVNKGRKTSKGTMSLNFAIFVLYQILSSASEPEVFEAVVTLILRHEAHVRVEELMKNPVMDPKDYNFVWNKLEKQHVEFSLVRYQYISVIQRFEYLIKNNEKFKADAEKEANQLSDRL